MSRKFAGLVILMVISSSFLWGQDRSKLQTWITQADTLMSRDDYDGAIKLLNKVVKESKLQTEEDYLALYNRAICHFSLGHFDQALADVNQYLNQYQEEHARMLRAYIYQEQGRTDLVLEEVSRLSSNDPDNIDFIQWKIDLLMDGKNYAAVRPDIRKLITLQPSTQLLAYLGMNYYYDDQPDSALTVFDEVIKTDPTIHDVYSYAASVCFEEDAYILALKYIELGLKNDPTDNELIFYKGIALVELSRTQEGCRCLTKAFNAGEDDAVDYLKEYCYGLD